MRLSEAARQAWPPFVLVTGLLLIGIVAHADGLFDQAGRLLERIPGPPAALLGASVVVVVAVTAVLNLDTAVVFLTPVLVLAARRRGLNEEPFLYAAVYMANASSLYLPGSNLTNLLVLARDPISGGTFMARLFVPALTATVVTAIGIYLLFRSRLRPLTPASAVKSVGQIRLGIGVLAAAAAAAATVALRHPALPVLCIGLLAVAWQVARGKVDVRSVLRAVGPGVLVALFLASVALGVLARSWNGPATLLAGAGRAETAVIGSVAAIIVNNLPATVLLSAHALPHPRALLLGLNIGPNLAVTGSLSAYLWFRAARQVNSAPSITAFSRRGIMLAPAAILAALAATSLLAAPN